MTALGKLILVGALAFSALAAMDPNPQETRSMQLGNFSVSLTVKDIEASKAFYEKLDFVQVGGVLEQNWVILQNGTTTVGLFQGMFENNLMTFNPGWNKDKETLKEFDDVRELQRTFKDRGITMVTEADESTKGPASFVITDPDGNTILFDQHVDSPAR
jgi:predicted enzyme related to lactoylglutathione lyase